MKYPSLSRNPMRTAGLPVFCGINYRDGMKIADNQLSEALNLWQNNGFLTTRPGFATGESMKKAVTWSGQVCNQRARVHHDIVNGEYYLVSVAVIKKRNNGRYKQKVYFLWQNDNDISGWTVGGPEAEISNESDFIGYFAFSRDNKLYCLYGDGTRESISADAADGTVWDNVSDAEIYAPNVYVHCFATSDSEFKGDMFEGFNAIGRYFKMIYSTVNRELITTQRTTVNMIYPLPDCVTRNNGEKVTATITHADGITVTHEAVFNNGTATETLPEGQESTQDGLIMKIEAANAVKFYSGENVATLTESDYVEDNMTLTLPRALNSNDESNVFGMTRCCWFSGTTGGTKDGSRLFLCGNSGDKKALVMWSGLNNPLYFNENCYFFAGDKSYAVTGFGKQNGKLIIFKENETLYSYYAQSDNITADDIINQAVIDYDANAVYFPLVSLSQVGCDAPDTIAVCRGRLIWADSSGHVWTLATVNKYGTLGVYEVSDMIGRKLAEYKENIKGASGIPFDGYYALVIGNEAYVMDCESSAFKYVSSYSDISDANAKIPWWRWEFPAGGTFYGTKDKILMTGFFTDGNGGIIATAALDRHGAGDKDAYFSGNQAVSLEIPSSFKTKFYDFGAPAFNKRIGNVNVSFGDNGGREILFEAEGESRVFTSVMLQVVDIEPGGIKNKIFRNTAPLTCRLRLCFSCYGTMAISDITIDYKYIGGAR